MWECVRAHKRSRTNSSTHVFCKRDLCLEEIWLALGEFHFKFVELSRCQIEVCCIVCCSECCSVSCGLLQRVAVSCSEGSNARGTSVILSSSMAVNLQCVAVCCSVLQCVAVCCSVLQFVGCVAVCVAVCATVCAAVCAAVRAAVCIAVCVAACVAVCAALRTHMHVRQIWIRRAW